MALVLPECFKGLSNEDKWQQIYEALYDASSTPGGGGSFIASGNWVGDAADETVFGFIQFDVAVEIDGGSLSAQDVPTGAAIQVQLTDLSDVEIAASTMTLAISTSGQNTAFAAPIAVAAGSGVRFKFKQIGSTIAGANIEVNLNVRNV